MVFFGYLSGTDPGTYNFTDLGSDLVRDSSLIPDPSTDLVLFWFRIRSSHGSY